MELPFFTNPEALVENLHQDHDHDHDSLATLSPKDLSEDKRASEGVAPMKRGRPYHSYQLKHKKAIVVARFGTLTPSHDLMVRPLMTM